MNTFFNKLFLLFAIAAIAFSLKAQPYTWLNETDSISHQVDRIALPDGYQRVTSPEGSFAAWLQQLPLKPGRPAVFLHNEQKKINQSAHYAVLNIDTGKRDLQQCADAVMRLRAEYLYAQKEYAQIHFNYTSGDRVAFTDWLAGKRPKVQNNEVRWTQGNVVENSYQQFRNYLTQIFIYAGTASLSREMKSVEKMEHLEIGDVFIQGGFPGHAVIVIDMAIHKESGEKIFLIAQSYMPAQDMHVLVNPNDRQKSPWYPLDFSGDLITPEWTFQKRDLKRWRE